MAQENTNATEGYQMKTGWGTIAMLISATGMGLVPLFSRWATRTDMFDGTMGLNAGDSIGALMACGRMGMGVLFFVILMVATHKVKTFKELKLTPAIALGGLMIGMSLACYVTSTLLTTVANAVLFIYTGPVICVLAARIFRKEPMSEPAVDLPARRVHRHVVRRGSASASAWAVRSLALISASRPSTPEFPQKGVGDAFGLAVRPLLRRRRCSSTATARTPTPRPAACGTSSSPCIGAGLITIVLNSLGSIEPEHGQLGAVNVHFTHVQLDRRRAPVDHLRSHRARTSCWSPAATCRPQTTAPSPTGRCPSPSSWASSSSARR